MKVDRNTQFRRLLPDFRSVSPRSTIVPIPAGLVSTDGKTGNLNVLYNQETNQPAANYSWSTNAGGQVTGIVYVNNFLGIVGKRYVYTNNTSKSGTLNEWQTLSNGSVIQTWEIMWNSNQSGQYTEWDTTGTIINSGTWN